MTTNHNTALETSLSSEESIDLKKVFAKIIDKWPWFLISIIICMIASVLYTKYTPPVYQITAKVLVNDNEKGGSLGKQAGALMDFGGLIGSKNSVDNETEILKTRFLMEQVVREMQLNIVYSQKSNLVSREVYHSPYKLVIIKGVDTIAPTILKIEEVKANRLKVTGKDFEKEVDFNQLFHLKGVGTIKVLNEKFPTDPKGKIIVSISSIDERVATLMTKLLVTVTNKNVSIIDLTLSYPLQRKGEDILNVLINRYISSSLEDKNVIADSTTKFIRQRLSIIAGELGDVENKVQDFKKSNKLADMTEQGRLLVQNSGEFGAELAQAETKVAILNDLENYLSDEAKNKRVFPSSILPSDMVFSNLIDQYNSLLIEREKQLLSLTEESPFVKNVDQQIYELRKGLLANIRSTKKSAILTRDKIRSQLTAVEGKVGEVPKIEKDYLKLARNQQIKQELYIFLMQKAEETAISKTSNISIAKIIDPPKSQFGPISPKKNVIYLAGLLFGIIIPVILLLLVDILNTTVSAKEDIINHTIVPIVGEISHNDTDDNLIVANKGRSAISEQFRALRTNLSFYLKNSDEKVILLTSSMSGEGKSFTAINLGNILALAGKKVLLMELDLRKPGLSAKLGVSNEIGFSNYTIDRTVKVQHIVKSLNINKNMFIVSSGPLPPNPAETLMSEHTPALIAELKQQFDYIIMDAPPIGVITDAQLLANYADVTLFLVRQKVTRKDQLAIVDDLFRSRKMKNLGIVVNDIVSKFYGYGYGYGTYGEHEKQSGFLEKLINKFK
jgi:tyrosine-protein kinase Etk/Wzc